MNDDPTPSQRDMMRKFYQAHNGQKDAVVAAYAEAERLGRVARKSNDYSIDAESYATALWRDGIKKGWLA